MTERFQTWVFGITVLASMAIVSTGHAQTPEPAAGWTFDQIQGKDVVEARSGERMSMKSPYYPPGKIEGPVGQAFRSDGYSNWIQASIPKSRQPSEALTAEAWVALESYPVSNAPFINKYTFPEAGYFFGMDPWGQWYLSVSINGEWYTCWAQDPQGGRDRFPREKWVHVASTFDSSTGEMRVYLNGTLMGTESVPSQALTVDSTTQTAVLRDVHTPRTAGMATGHLNGAFDEVFLYDEALSQSQIQSRVSRGSPPSLIDSSETPYMAHLPVEESRFADDPHRPAYHAMPSANWTNEPHGLVYHEGKFHLFHQRNPNGPYFQRLRWGHLTSPDLVNWNERPVALTQGLSGGLTDVGVWSGDAVVDDGTLTPVYTAASSGGASVGIARRQEDGTFERSPANPVIPGPPANRGFFDFRDPYVFQQDGRWHMLIGSGRRGGGGAALHYTSSNLEDWNYQGPAFEAPADQAGTFWEMPIMMELGDGKYIFQITTLGGGPARALYWIGEWDGNTFSPDHPKPKQLDLINLMLSPAISRDVKNRIVTMGIVPQTRPTQATRSSGWVNVFNLPRQWQLCEDKDDLCQTPAPQLKTLRRDHVRRTNVEISPDGRDVLPGVGGDQIEMKAVFSPDATGTYGIELRSTPIDVERTRIAYDSEAEELIVNLRSSTLSPSIFNARRDTIPYDHPPDEPLTIHAFVDHSVLDVFIDNEEAFTTRLHPTLRKSEGVDVFTKDNSVTVESVDVWRVASDKPFPDSIAALGDGDSATLQPISPNPISGGTANVTFQISSSQQVTMTVYDMLGRKVATIFDRPSFAGTKTVRWSPSSTLASGVYFVRLRTDSGTKTRRLVLTR